MIKYFIYLSYFYLNVVWVSFLLYFAMDNFFVYVLAFYNKNIIFPEDNSWLSGQFSHIFGSLDHEEDLLQNSRTDDQRNMPISNTKESLKQLEMTLSKKLCRFLRRSRKLSNDIKDEGFKNT